MKTPNDIAILGGFAYVTAYDSNTVVKLNLSFPSGPDFNPNWSQANSQANAFIEPTGITIDCGYAYIGCKA